MDYKHLQKFDYGDSKTEVKYIRSKRMYGLFASRYISRGSKIAYYPGIVVPETYSGMWEDYKIGTMDSGYVFIPYMSGILKKAERGISFLAAFSNEPSEKKPANAQGIIGIEDTTLIVRKKYPKAGLLISMRNIGKGEEITWCYGDGYTLRKYKTSCPKKIS